MLIIKENNNNTLIIKKSKFIGFIYYVNNIDEIINILNELKIEYNDATHICFAYKINDYKKYNDDNEPNGTSGEQILKSIEVNNINNCLGVVIRYFGGIKLGIGGLSRSYYKTINELIKNTKKEEYIKKVIIEIKTNLCNQKLLNNITKNLNIINKEFDNKITYVISLDKNELDSFIKTIDNNLFTYIVKED